MLKLNALFSKHAVLQRDMVVPVWGWSVPYDVVTISIDEAKVCTVADCNGAFMAELPPHGVGGPYTLIVAGKTESVTVDDVMFGEVWLASGQSNMEMPLIGFNVPIMTKEELDNLEFPENFRMMYVPKTAVTHKVGSPNGKWLMCNNHKNYQFMSAYASFFAKKLGKELGGIPVGIISANWGGTYAEAWMSRESLRKLTNFAEDLAKYEKKISSPDYLAFKMDYTNPAEIAPVDTINMANLQTYFDKHPEVNPEKEPDLGYQRPDFDDSDWTVGELPKKNWTMSHQIKNLGVVWFRKEVEIPAAWEGHTLMLNIGAVDKQDVTYFNGLKIGSTGSDFETGWWSAQRIYKVPADMTKAGRAVIAVRAYSFLFDGGMIGPEDCMKITCPEVDDQEVPLAGAWKARQSIDFGGIPVACLTAPSSSTPFTTGEVSACGLESAGFKQANSYHILFDSMIAPLIPYAIRGVIWYQGCNNECLPQYYEELMTALIKDWRNRWNQPEFAFIQTLLAGYNMSALKTWSQIRTAQINSAVATGTDFVSATDLGDPTDIHPLRKEALGYRCADVALAIAYGKDIEAYGPQPAGVLRNCADLVLLLDHADGLYAKNDVDPAGFELVDANGNARPVVPEIKDNTLVFRNIPEDAVAVRYAWDNYPVAANCYNGADLPMVPFTQSI